MSITISFNNVNFTPTPNINISTEYLTVGSGISKIHNITLNGLLFAGKSPGYSGLSGIRSPDSTGILSLDGINYKVKTISSNLEPTNDNWANTIRYSMNFEGVLTSENPGFNTSTNWLVTRIQDDWSFEALDENFKNITQPDFDTKLYTEKLTNDLYTLPTYPFFKITRTVGAVGRYELDYPNSLENAKLWIENYMGQNGQTTTEAFLSNFGGVYNHIRNVNKSSTDGSYTVTDTWVASRNNNNYIQTLNIESSLDRDATRTVSINGEIKGLSNSNKTWTSAGPSGKIIDIITDDNTKYTNAFSRFSSIQNTFLGMAQNMLVTPTSRNKNEMLYDNQFKFINAGDAGFNRNETPTINPIPVSSGVTHSKTDGSIKFNIVYNNKPINYFSGISETINVQDSIGMKKIITQLVMYGPPILQDLGTKSSNTRTINIDAKFANYPTVQNTIEYYNILKGKRDSIKKLAESLNPKNILDPVPSPNLEIKSFLKDSSAKIDVVNNSVSCNFTYEWVFRGKTQ
jgi:hypothetical protein